MTCTICDDDRFPNHPDTLICGRDFYTLARMLDPAHTGDRQRPEDNPPSIPVLFALLSPGKKPATGEERTAPGIVAAAPIDVHHVAMRDRRSHQRARVWTDRAGRSHREQDNAPLSAEAVLAAWAFHLAEQRGVVPPRAHDPWPRPWHYIGPMTLAETAASTRVPPRPDVELLAGYLHRHLTWAAAQSWVVVMADELRRLSNQLRTAVQTETGEYRPKPFTDCPAVLDTDEAGADIVCGSPLFPPRMGDTIRCHTCGAGWMRDDWWPAQTSERSLAVAS